MNSIISICSLVFLVLVCSMTVVAQNSNPINVSPFTNFGRNALTSFTGENMLWVSTAIVSTYLISKLDIDYAVHRYFSDNIDQYDRYTTLALWGGYVAPLAVGGGIYLWGKYSEDPKIYSAGCAVLQAAGIAQLMVSVLKAFTGRPNPDPTTFTDMREASHLFRFGFLRGGLHYGWPSGHLAVNSAVITSLMTFYNKSVPMQVVGVACICYMIFGVSAHEGATMHWFSDVVAGTIIGSIIGVTVGNDFRDQMEDSIVRSSRTQLNITPKISSRFSGIQINIPI